LSKLIPKHVVEKFSWILHNSFTNSRITCIPCGIPTCRESLSQFDKIVHNFPFWLCRHPSRQSVSWRYLSSVCLCQLGLLTDLWKIDHSQDFYHEETPLLNFCNPIAFILMRTIWGLQFQKFHDRSVTIRAWLLELILSRTFVGHDDVLPALSFTGLLFCGLHVSCFELCDSCFDVLCWTKCLACSTSSFWELNPPA
jgi:hypothetical protein